MGNNMPGNMGNMGNAMANMMGMGNMGGQMGNMMGMGNMGGGGQGCCILVSNLNEEKATPDALFALFGVYGNVHRVKILYNKRDNAMIQMQDANQANQAITNLDKCMIWGKPLRVANSKISVIQMPKDGQSDAGLTKDFVNCQHHRFKKPNSKNYIFPPTSVLHLYNVNTMEEDVIRALFSEHGTVLKFKFFQNDRKMALIEMSNVEEATQALVGLHNYQVAESLHMRVSFSRSTIQ